MAVFRVEKNSNYTTMCNYHLRDQNLSLKAKGLKGLLSALEAKEMLSQVQSIDFGASSSFLTMRYQDRLTVKMGLNDDFAYDLKMLAAVEEKYITENWSAGDTGTLDMTSRDDGQAVLSRD